MADPDDFFSPHYDARHPPVPRYLAALLVALATLAVVVLAAFLS
jgi:hypothetical protein